MKNFRNNIFKIIYLNILRPILFLVDPEKIHDIFTEVGELLGRFESMRCFTRLFFDFRHHSLQQDIRGLHFISPIGLAAGFDKNARMINVMSDVGFGFTEIGTVTGNACAGNKGKRLWRHTDQKALRVYYGLKNDGCEIISNKLRGKAHDLILGVSVGKTNDGTTVATQAAIADYVKAYESFKGIADYITVNISCPNAFGGEPFASKERLDSLLSAINDVRYDSPIFIKISPDMSGFELDDIIEIAKKYKIDGFISTNLTKKHQFGDGGLSGGAVKDLSNKQIAYLYKKTKGEFIIIGCGGVFTAQDAYKKIRLGASLIQMITGMIYMGPQTISDINMGLVELMKKDGFSNIREAVGVDSM
ncbi:quinone-dependent dihydroorotate dehydrogenase [Patescibacteria group bacterium]|nr:quinone-dependent dihydroorotate dehydrogenase [Patescibacteria group bacterium]